MKKKTLLIAITSGIAAYKVLDLLENLKSDFELEVVCTKNALNIVSAEEIKKITGKEIHVELFPENFDLNKILEERSVEHVSLADKIDLAVVVPATANCLGKLAHGIADDLLTTTLLATTAFILLCPSMNVNMWRKVVVQDNLNLLRQRNFQILEPVIGNLACGYTGKGRLPEINLIEKNIRKLINKTESLKNKKIIITAGGTQEPIDSVRFISNRSSGKMGAALAQAACLRGAEVTLIRAKMVVPANCAAKEILFSTADELEKILSKEIKSADIIFHAAAVSDFKIRNKLDGKNASDKKIGLELEPRTKILDKIKKINKNIFLVAFKAEHNLSEKELIKVAKTRMAKSKADLIIANDISRSDRGFEADTNEVVILSKNNGQQKVALTSKKEIAVKILDFLEKEIS